MSGKKLMDNVSDIFLAAQPAQQAEASVVGTSFVGPQPFVLASPQNSVTRDLSRRVLCHRKLPRTGLGAGIGSETTTVLATTAGEKGWTAFATQWENTFASSGISARLRDGGMVWQVVQQCGFIGN
jgi:hypothetical protein